MLAVTSCFCKSAKITILFILQIFAKNIFGILNSIKAREEGKLKNPIVNATPMPHPKPSSSGPNYNRYDQERFAKDKNSKYCFKNRASLFLLTE